MYSLSSKNSKRYPFLRHLGGKQQQQQNTHSLSLCSFNSVLQCIVYTGSFVSVKNWSSIQPSTQIFKLHSLLWILKRKFHTQTRSLRGEFQVLVHEHTQNGGLGEPKKGRKSRIQNGTKHAHFRGSPLFPRYVQHKDNPFT